MQVLFCNWDGKLCTVRKSYVVTGMASYAGCISPIFQLGWHAMQSAQVLCRLRKSYIAVRMAYYAECTSPILQLGWQALQIVQLIQAS